MVTKKKDHKSYGSSARRRNTYVSLSLTDSVELEESTAVESRICLDKLIGSTTIKYL